MWSVSRSISGRPARPLTVSGAGHVSNSQTRCGKVSVPTSRPDSTLHCENRLQGQSRARSIAVGATSEPGVTTPPSNSSSEAASHAGLTPTIGTVLYAADGYAVVSGLNDDAPTGASVSFKSGATGVVIWREGGGACYVVITEGQRAVKAGEAAACIICGIKNTFDGEDGLEVKPEFAMLTVPVGGSLQGLVVDSRCRPLPSQGHVSTDAQPRIKLLNEQVAMGDREVISQPLFTGIKAIDVLSPLARGCAMLAAGDGAGQTATLLHILSNLASTSSSRLVYAAVGCSQAEMERRVVQLRAAGAMRQCTVVAAGAEVPLGEQYAAVCAAVAIGEEERDRGGHALVVVDSLECMVSLWESVTQQACRIGARDMTAAEEEMVELNGMLVSAAAAQRRQFFSSCLQRAAKVKSSLGGGTLTLLFSLPGTPATGDRTASATQLPAVDSYKHLSDELMAKLAAALAAKRQDATVDQAAHSRTQTIEEVMSIADGQMVLSPELSEGTTSQLDATSSLSRMGSRAYHPALKELAPQVRFELIQASDAERFAAADRSKVHESKSHLAQVITAALAQPRHTCAPLSEVAALLWVVSKGGFEHVDISKVQEVWSKMWSDLQREAADKLEHIDDTKQLTAESKAAIQSVCL